MNKLFYPESVVVYGVSSSPTNLGSTIIRNLEGFKFKGRVYAVGSEGGDLNGRKIVSGLGETRGDSGPGYYSDFGPQRSRSPGGLREKGYPLCRNRIWRLQ